MSQNRFVFVAPMRNASATLGQMLASIVAQSYDRWRIVLVDDASDPAEVTREAETITRWRNVMRDDGPTPRVHVTWNATRLWETANVLRGVFACEPDEIVCRIDADDVLCDVDALTILDGAYRAQGCDAAWTMHRWGFSDRNISGPMPQDADPHTFPWRASHMKTFRRRLLDGVPYENFTNMDGELVRRCGDQALYLPVLKRATNRVFVPRVLYRYNIVDVPETYQTDDAKFQKAEAEFIRARGYVSEGQPWEERLGLQTQQIPAMFCEHANEVPHTCPCSTGCYCKSHTCRIR